MTDLEAENARLSLDLERLQFLVASGQFKAAAELVRAQQIKALAQSPKPHEAAPMNETCPRCAELEARIAEARTYADEMDCSEVCGSHPGVLCGCGLVALQRALSPKGETT